MALLTLVMVLAALAWAAGRWGADSRADVASGEWCRLQAWPGFGHER